MSLGVQIPFRSNVYVIDQRDHLPFPEDIKTEKFKEEVSVHSLEKDMDSFTGFQATPLRSHSRSQRCLLSPYTQL